MLRSTLLVTLCAIGAPALASAQQAKKPLTARNFQFDDYRSVVELDMKTVRETGVWDEISTSALKMTLGMLQEQLGFPLDHLDRIRSTRGPRPGQGKDAPFCEVVVVEGNAALGTPKSIFGNELNVEPVGDYELLLDPWNEDEAVVMVTPKLRVSGLKPLLVDVLEGKPRNGLPSADVMAFTAGRKRVMFQFVADLLLDDGPKRALEGALEGVTWPEGDRPTMACGRMLATGDEDDPHVTLELVLRHGTAGEGLAVTEKAVQAGLDKLAKMTQARMFRPLLKKVEHERDGTDAIWRVDLGRARHAAGLLGTVTPFMMVTTKAQAVPAAQAVEVVEEVEAEPAEKPKAGGGR